ncbi:MAG: hypothetical protein ACRD7E_06660 [Bryobacteraceae bacterium]
MTIVGVVGDVKQGSSGCAQVYVPPSLLEPGPLSRTVNLVVGSNRDTASLIVDLRGALQRLFPALPMSKAPPLEEIYRRVSPPAAL